MDTRTLHNAAETQALGESWGKEAREGWVFGLVGDLGAGKTELVKGLARGLGIQGRVQSPTFSLVNEYSGGRLALFHLDLYRLESTEEIARAGLEEFLFSSTGVVAVEWFDRWCGGRQTIIERGWHPNRGTPGAGPRLRRVVLETVDESVRRMTYEDFGV